MKTIKQLFTFFILTISLTGCGSSDDKSASASKDAFGNRYNGAAITITGKVIDGYLIDALVCVDANENDRCDSTDPSSTTDSKGGYSISVPKTIKDKQYNLLAFAIANKTTDSDWPNQPIEKGYSLSAPWDSNTITPFTTMVVGVMKDGSFSKALAEERVKEHLKIDFIDKDYIAMKSAVTDEAQKGEDMHRKAKMLVHAIASIREQFNTIDGSEKQQRSEGAYAYYMKEAATIESLLSDIKDELEKVSTDAVDFDTLQKLLTDKAIERINGANNHSFKRAHGYKDVISAEEKTQLLKHYLSSGMGDDPTLGGTIELDSFSLEDNQWDSEGEVYENGQWSKSYYSDSDIEEGVIYVRKDNKFKEFNVDKGVEVSFDKQGNVLVGEDKFLAMTVKHKLDLSRQPLFLKNINNDVVNFGGVFTAGAEELILLKWYTEDTYSIDSWTYAPDDTGYQLPSDTPTTLTEQLNQHKFTDDKVVPASENDDGYQSPDNFIGIPQSGVFMQFDISKMEKQPNSGPVRFYQSNQEDNSSYDLIEDIAGSWHKETLPGSDREIVRVEIPKPYQGNHSAYFFIVLEDPYNRSLKKVWMGEIIKAGTDAGGDFMFNEIAKNDIKNAIASGRYVKN